MTSSVFGGIHSFFQSATWLAIETMAVAFVLLFWAATVYWVRKDAKRRIGSHALVRAATILATVPPFLGPLVYMLFRPPEYLDDVRERELEIQAIERRLGMGDCPKCHAAVDPEFLVCPICATRLRSSCVTCLRPLDSKWLVCPYCETPVSTGEVRPELWPSTTAIQPAASLPQRASRSSRTSSRKAT